MLRPVFEQSGGVDGRVSLEVDPRLAFDTAATVTAAQQIWSDVDRPNVMVKIPATRAGLPAITETLASGISVNVTLDLRGRALPGGPGRLARGAGVGQRQRA